MGYSTSFLLGYSTMFIGFSWIFQHFYWDPCCNPGPGVCIHLDPAWPCGWTGQRDRPTTWTGAAILGEKTWVVSTGNRQCRAHGLQNARISCGEVNVRSRAYPLNTSDLWRFWRTFLEFCCGAYVFRYQRLLGGFALLLFGSSGAIGNSCRVELVGCLPFPSPMGLSSGWKALRVQQGEVQPSLGREWLGSGSNVVSYVVLTSFLLLLLPGT